MDDNEDQPDVTEPVENSSPSWDPWDPDRPEAAYVDCRGGLYDWHPGSGSYSIFPSRAAAASYLLLHGYVRLPSHDQPTLGVGGFFAYIPGNHPDAEEKNVT